MQTRPEERNIQKFMFVVEYMYEIYKVSRRS